MKCFVNAVITDGRIKTDIKDLITDAGMRRRMSRVVKMSVATAVECVGGAEYIDDIDAIITATGFGCLTDSERFLRNMIADDEQLLNPTPFIQSTFNTVGGQIAMLRHNHCYNVTYANRSHSFEDALLDALMLLEEEVAGNILIGAFDELTPSLQQIISRMGLLRGINAGEGSMFANLSSVMSEKNIAEIVCLEFPDRRLTEEECREKYATCKDTVVLSADLHKYGIYPSLSARIFADAIDRIISGEHEVIVYNEYMGGAPTIIVLRCIG